MPPSNSQFPLWRAIIIAPLPSSLASSRYSRPSMVNISLYLPSLISGYRSTSTIIRPNLVTLAFAIRFASTGSSVMRQNKICPMANRFRLLGVKSHPNCPNTYPMPYCTRYGKAHRIALNSFIQVYNIGTPIYLLI